MGWFGHRKGEQSMIQKLVPFALVIAFLGSACDSGDGGSSEPICTPQEKACDGNDVLKCTADGTDWTFFKSCDDGCEDGECLVVCEPLCDNKECGDDGCGGSCGDCSQGWNCQASQCVQELPPCGSITYEGVCEGNTLKFCLDGYLLSKECDTACGLNEYSGLFDCLGCDQFKTCSDGVANGLVAVGIVSCSVVSAVVAGGNKCVVKYPCELNAGNKSAFEMICMVYDTNCNFCQEKSEKFGGPGCNGDWKVCN